MRTGILSFVAGVWWLQQQAALPALDWAWAAALGGLAVAMARPDSAALCAARGIAILAACFALGYVWAAACAHQRLADALPVEWEGRDVTVLGVVAGLPQSHERGVRFEFDIELVLTPGARTPQQVVLSWWGSPAQGERPATYP